MKRPIKKEFENYAKNYKRRKSWQRVVSMLTCIIVFCTTYALILPAITLAGEAACGCEEHVHTDGCYEVLTEQRLTCDPVHVHTADCYENGTLVCGRADYVLHTHNDSCFSESGEMLCSLRKLEEHTHGEACYTVEETVTGHLHSDDCYSVELGEIVCGLEETEAHTHSDSCHEEIRTLICELEEDGVITEEQVLICTKPEVTAHTHTDSCYEITKDEDGEEIRVLICTELEVLEHQHSAECIGAVANRGQLLCREEAHVHGLICYADPAADLEYAQLWERTMDSVVLSGDATADLVAIAETQIGYVESVKNYIVLEDGATIKGYTRYGQWNGTPYESWNELFVSFCMHYAEIDERVFFGAEEGTSWSNALMHHAAFVTSKHTPEPGDLILLNVDDTYYIGIVSGIGSDGYVTAIIGDYQNEVVKDTFTPNDPVIAGYADMSAALAMVLDATPGDDMAAEVPSEPVEVTDPTEGDTIHEMPHISASIQLVLELGKTDTEAASEEGQLQGGSQNTAKYNNSGIIDMADFIKDVTVYHKTTGWGDTWKELVDPNIVKDGDLVRFGISYEVPGGTLSAANNSISYQLPLTSTSTANSGNVTNSKGEIVGTYSISQSGLLTITFSDHYVEQNAGGVVIDGTINLDTEANALQTDSEGNVKLEFSDNEIVEIKVQQTVKDDLTVEKSAGSVNSDGTVTYTITVSSKNGTAEDVVLSDWMNNVTYLSGFNVKKNGEDVTSTVTNPTAGANSIALTLPQMAAGDTYTITYTGIISGITNGTASAGNGVTVTSKDGEGNTLTDSANVRVDYTDNTLAKSGMVTSDGKVNWTITIGRAGESLKDWVLSDQINGAPLQAPVNIVYTDASGNSVNVTEQQLPYTFPDGAYGPVTVTYTTSLDYNIGANNMSNVATLLPPSGKPVYTGSTNVQDPNQNGSYYPLDKTAGDLTVADDGDGTKSAIIDWTYTINASGGGIYVSDQGGEKPYWFFSDYLQNGQYFTDDQWAALCSNLRAAMIAAFNDPAVYNGANWDESNVSQLYSITPTYSGDKIAGYRVEVYENMLKGTKLSYTYQSTGDLGDGTSQQYFQNQANLNNKTWDSASVNYVPVIAKLDGTSYSASDSQHAYMDLKNGVISWRIRVSLPADTTNVVITEDLPDNLELSGLTLYFPNYGGSATLNLTGDTTITYGGASYTITTADATASGSTDKKLTITIPDALIAAFGGSSFDILVETKLHEHTSGCSLSCEESSSEHTHTDGCYSCDQLTAEDIGKSDSGYVEFNNSVSVSYKENGTTDKTAGDSHKQTITNEDTTQQLVKTAGTYANNKVPYTIEINPNGSDLAEGDVLTIHDALSFWKEKNKTLLNAALLNVNVAVVNSDGTTTNLSLTDAVDKVDANHFYYTYLQRDSYDENPYNTWYQELHELEFTVPDNTHLKITYEYLLTGMEQTGTTISNTAYLREVAQNGSSGTSNWYVVQESAATAELKSIYVYKVDADNYANRLGGAKFELYKWDADSEKWVFDHIIESDNSAELELLGLSINQAYYLIEVEAPDGYVLDQTRHYFMLYDSTKSYMTAPEDFPQTAYYTQGRAIYITNEKEGTSVSATKTWQDASGNTIDAPDGSSVDVQLMQVWSRYPSSFDTSTLGTSATVSLAFGEYSSDTSVFGPVSINTHVGDMIYITLRTKNLPTKTNVKVWNETTQQYEWEEREMAYPAGLMEVTDEANNHLPYTVEGPDESGYYTYTFSYLVTATNRTLRGWVYPENNDATASYSITSYTALAGTNTVESEYGSVVTLSSSNGWNYTWGNLPEYEMDSIGRITGYYSYYVQETAVNGATGYVPSYSTADNGTLVITNKQMDTVELEVVKQWVDKGGNVVVDTSGYEPISFGLYRIESYSVPTGGTPSTDDREGTLLGTYTLSGTNSWTWSSDALPKEGVDSNGNKVYYTYYIRETVPTGYSVTYSAGGATFNAVSPNVVDDGTVTIRNTDTGKIAIEVEKKWQDSNGATVDAPVDAITVELFKQTGEGGGTEDGGTEGGGTEGGGTTTPTKTVTVNFYETGIYDWEANDNTPKVVLDNVPSGSRIIIQYIAYENDNSYIVVGETKVEKTSADSSEFVGYADWDNGHSYPLNRYTFYVQITDDATISVVTGTSGYNTVIDADGNAVEGLAVNQVSARLDALPAVATIADDNSSSSWTSLGTYDLTAANSWKYLIENLEPGTYKIEEVTTGYTVTYTVNGVDGNSGSMTDNSTVVVTNTVSTETVNVPVNKLWFAADGVTAEVPDDITEIQFYLKQNGTKMDANPDTTDVDPYVLTKDNNWEMVIRGLPKYDSSNNAYTYTVDEVVIDGYAVTYSHNEDDGSWTITNTSTTIDLPVSKLWFAADGVTAITPEETSIQFYLLQNGTRMDADSTAEGVNPYTLTAENSWQMIIEDLPKSYTEDGEKKDYVYTIEEVPVEGYDSEVTVTDGSYTITNTKLMAITVRKFWQNADGDERPPLVDSIQFNLYQITTENGVEVETLLPGAPFTLTKDTGWELTIWDLEPGTYRIEEITTDYLKGYVQYDYSSSSGGALGDTATFVGGETDVVMDMTNTPYMNLTVDKTWDGTPMDDLVIELQLYRMESTTSGSVPFDLNTAVKARTNTETLDASVKWHKTFKNLPLYRVEPDGTYVYYTYYAVEVTTGYVVAYLDAEGNTLTNTITTTGSMTISNEATSIEVTKNWVHKDGNPLTDVPDSIEFYILQNGTVYDPDPTDDVAQPTFTLSAADGWNKVFYGLPLMDEYGNYYTYTVQEIALDGYVSMVENQTIAQSADLKHPAYASTITNMDTGSTDISVEKVWDTTADTAVQVQLYRIESTTPPSTDAVGEAGTVTEQIWSPELNYVHGYADGTPGEQVKDVFGNVIGDIYYDSDGRYYGWWPRPGDGGTLDSSVRDNGDGTTTYMLTWTLDDWMDYYGGCLSFNVKIPDACYATNNGSDVSNVKVKIDGNDWTAVSPHIGPEWDNNGEKTNNLIIEWYNIWNGNNATNHNNAMVVYNSVYVEFTLPTRRTTTDYPEHETNVTSDYLIANNAKVVTNSGTYIPYTADINSGSNLSTDNYTLLSYGNSWQHTWSDLPLYGLDESGNLVYYTYYVLEISDSDSWYPSYSVTDPITSGIIGITNNDTPEYEEPSYELPATGGSGTFPYTLGGIFLLMAGCAVLMYNKKKGRKGAHTP